MVTFLLAEGVCAEVARHAGQAASLQPPAASCRFRPSVQEADRSAPPWGGPSGVATWPAREASGREDFLEKCPGGGAPAGRRRAEAQQQKNAANIAVSPAGNRWHAAVGGVVSLPATDQVDGSRGRLRGPSVTILVTGGEHSTPGGEVKENVRYVFGFFEAGPEAAEGASAAWRLDTLRPFVSGAVDSAVNREGLNLLGVVRPQQRTQAGRPAAAFGVLREYSQDVTNDPGAPACLCDLRGDAPASGFGRLCVRPRPESL